MRQLCIDLNMPEEVTERLVYHIENLDPSLYRPYFEGLFSLETGNESINRISEAVKTKEDPTGDNGLKSLAVFMVAARHTREIYAQLGINDEIFIASLKALSRFVREHKVSYGYYGFDRGFWIYRQLSAKLFRLGTLEFEMTSLSKDAEPVGPASGGSPILSVHIPSDALLTREELDNSYRMAQEFFAKHFPDFQYKCFYCCSWLLSPVLKQILEPGSRILNFQSDYEITHVDLESNSGLIWIYKRNYQDFTQLPEETTLMRRMKKILLEGGKIGIGTGYVKKHFI